MTTRIDRRRCSAGLAASSAAIAAWPTFTVTGANSHHGGNVLRVLLPAAETGFDPARIGDIYSATVIAHILEAPYGYDPLAVPPKVVPLTAAALPEVSSDFRVWTIRLQRGIHFTDDPAFHGAKRELVAADVAYAYKRHFDPVLKSPSHASLREDGVIGLEALRTRAIATQRPFDYDAPVEGMRVLDRHTLQIRLAAPRPRFLWRLASSGELGAVAREVVEAYGDDIMAHPVGTGPYRLKSWRRSSRIVIEKNPQFRELRYSAEPAVGDPEGQAWLARFAGRRLPFNDGVDIAVIDEAQPRWLTFLAGGADILRLPVEFADLAAPHGVLAPHLAKRGVRAHTFLAPDTTMTWFNMEDPVVGGYSAEKVALRRAIGLAYDIGAEIRVLRHGRAIAAQAPMPPGTYGHDPALLSENGLHDPAHAKALLDLYGWRDRDGDGWRELPDGTPLALRMATQGSLIERQFDQHWERCLAAVGLRLRFATAQWPENLKAARAGRLQMWSMGSTASQPDALPALERCYGPAAGSANLARFNLPAFDAIYRRMIELPDGPERAALFVEATKLTVAYMPYKLHVHRVLTDLVQPWIAGWRQPMFGLRGWQYVAVDAEMRERVVR